jgi:aryl-alcohol dehydrogenase-like predicted oxidoreductase
MPRSPKEQTPELGLGTVQLGLPYGVSNTVGQTPISEARDILSAAKSHGVRYLDTARAYGTSEEVLGELTKGSESFRIITKLPPLPTNIQNESEIRAWVKDNINSSLAALRIPSAYGVLIHNPLDAVSSFAKHIIAGLRECVELGLVSNIGVSIYDRDQIDRVTDSFRIDIVQVPVNIFDQRLLKDNTLYKLKSDGIEIHARSIFLQGLLLMRPEDAPSYFDPIRAKLISFHRSCEAWGVSPVVAGLNFVKTLPIDVGLIGVNTHLQFKEIVESYERELSGQALSDFGSFEIRDPNFVNPALWRF